MKSTKRILSAILALCMVFGCFAVGFTAQATSADLQAAIDAAIAAGTDVEWKGGNVTVEKTIVINGDVDVNFNNAVLTGADGISVLDVKGGKVTLYNGTFIANSKAYSGETGFIKSLMSYRPAVSVNGGDVTFDCITAVGSLIRIPNSGTIEVTSGNGINANTGNVTVKDSIVVGMKAIDNTKATVVIEDALLVGIYKAVNDYNKVTFADGYKQYRSVQFLKDFLKDGVTLTPGEERYFDSLTNSQGAFSAGSVIASVKAPEFEDLTSEYANNVLTLTAKAGAADEEKAGVPNRYSYKYTPVSVTVEDKEGVSKAAFVKQNDGTYKAEVAAKADTTYTATTAYKLSVKLGKEQKEVVENSLDLVAAYAKKAPELLYRFVKDFENLWAMAEDYVGMAYGVLTDELTAGAFDSAEMNELLGLIYAVMGENYAGSDQNSEEKGGRAYNEEPGSSQMATILRAYNAGRFTAEQAYAQIEAAALNERKADRDRIAEGFTGVFENGEMYAFINNELPENIDDITEEDLDKYGMGIGLLQVFEKYYFDCKEYIYGEGTKEFVNPAAAAKLLGDNWTEIYDLYEAALTVFYKMEEIINSDSGEVKELLEKAGLTSLVGAFNKAAAYLDKVVSRVDKDMIAGFAGKYPNLGDKCAEYTKKFMDIAYNPSKYFELDVKGDFINVFDYEDTQTVSTPSEKPVRVEVTVTGPGSVDFDGDSVSALGVKFYNLGEEISIIPVGENLQYIAVESNNNRTVVDGESFVAKAASNLEIKVVFASSENVSNNVAEVVFMTDKNLGYKYLDTVEATAESVNEFIFTTPVLPEFKDLEFTGWSMTAAEIAQKITDGAAVVLVYANYKNLKGDTVIVPEQDELVKMTDITSLKGKVYFEATFQVPAEYTVIEAGIFVTKNTEYAASEETMTIELSGKPGVPFGRIEDKDPDGSIKRNVVYTAAVTVSGTVYARGYVVYSDAEGNVNVAYTDGVSQITV